jgi:hypothetical protein
MQVRPRAQSQRKLIMGEHMNRSNRPNRPNHPRRLSLAWLAIVIATCVGTLVAVIDRRPAPVASFTHVRGDDARQRSRLDARGGRRSSPALDVSDDLPPEYLAPQYGEEVSMEEQIEREALADRSEARMRDLTSHFAAEPKDAGWAGAFAERIRAALAQSGVKPGMVRAVDCRSSMCRIEVSLADGTAYLGANLLASFGMQYRIRTIPASETGPATLEVFMARPEHAGVYSEPPGASGI